MMFFLKKNWRLGQPAALFFPGAKGLAVIVTALVLCFSGSGRFSAWAGEPSAVLSPADDAIDDAGEFDDFEDLDNTVSVSAPDPLGGYNRFMTRVNDTVYVWAFRPIARGYRWAAPEPARLAVARVFANLGYPARCLNNLLQLKIHRAGVETCRFIVNTTLGVGGLFDLAEGRMNLRACPEDFGQTLGRYGMGPGWHLVLPFLGPSNLRDTLGLAPNLFLNPVVYIEDDWTRVGVSALDRVNTLSLFMNDYDALRAEALDLYIFQRDAYEMKRKKETAE